MCAFHLILILQREILQYLDEVDYNCDRTSSLQVQQIPELFRSDIEYSIDADIVGDIPK